jgi:hypothetical protein
LNAVGQLLWQAVQHTGKECLLVSLCWPDRCVFIAITSSVQRRIGDRDAQLVERLPLRTTAIETAAELK